MTCVNFLMYSPSDRFQMLVKDSNPDYIHQLLVKYHCRTMEESKSKYDIELNSRRQRIFISGSFENIFHLHNLLLRYKVKCESVQADQLRIDYSQFLFKLK